MMKNLLVVICTLAILHSAWSLTFRVEPKSEECFYADVKPSTNVELTWAVIDGGLLDIRVAVKAGDLVLYDKLYFEGKDNNRYQTISMAYGSTTRYSFCFDNNMARFTPKTVSFTLSMEEKVKHSPDDVSPMEKSLIKIGADLTAIEEEQEYMRWREMTHRNTAESTNERVKWWSIFESLILVGMSVGQVFYLRRMFNSNAARGV